MPELFARTPIKRVGDRMTPEQEVELLETLNHILAQLIQTNRELKAIAYDMKTTYRRD